MSEPDRERLSRHPSGHVISTDLLLAMTVSVIVGVVILRFSIGGTLLGHLIAIPFVFFLPGYALVAAGFPADGDAPAAGTSTPGVHAGRAGLDEVERLALSFGISIALLPLVGLGLLHLHGGIGYTSGVVALVGITLGGTGLAILRRARIPPAVRYVFPHRLWPRPIDESRDIVEMAVNLTLAMSVILAVVTIGFAVAQPHAAPEGVDFFVLSPNDAGEFVASGYPTTASVDENITLGVGVHHHGPGTAEYTVIIQLERVAEDGEREIVEADELERVEGTLEPGDRLEQVVEISPSFSGEGLRISFLLYDGWVPNLPNDENAAHSLHLWLDVTD